MPEGTPPRLRETLHSLKNNLSSVLGYCELLLESTDAADPRRQDLLALQTAVHAAMRNLDTLRRDIPPG